MAQYRLGSPGAEDDLRCEDGEAEQRSGRQVDGSRPAAATRHPQPVCAKGQHEQRVHPACCQRQGQSQGGEEQPEQLPAPAVAQQRPCAQGRPEKRSGISHDGDAPLPKLATAGRDQAGDRRHPKGSLRRSSFPDSMRSRARSETSSTTPTPARELTSCPASGEMSAIAKATITMAG